MLVPDTQAYRTYGIDMTLFPGVLALEILFGNLSCKISV